jgi:DNA polymerase-3 subunit alpha
VLAPDINRSQLRFSVEPGVGVRFGLTAIKGLGETAVEAILAARTEMGGRIPSLHGLCELLDLRMVNKRVLEALVKSGACDALVDGAAPLGVRRAALFAAIDGACEHGARTQRARDLGQADLFGGGDDHASEPMGIRLPDAVPWTEIEQLTYEKESLGLYWTGHPIDRYAEDLKRFGAVTTARLVPARDVDVVSPAAGEAPGEALGAPTRVAEDVAVGGIVTAVRALKTRRGDRMCVVTLEDAAGGVEVVVFPEAFKQFGHLADTGRMVVIKGRFERDDESTRVLASEILPIETVREQLTQSVAIHLSTPPHDRATVERLWDVLVQHRGDRPVAIDIELRERTRHLRVKVDVNAQIRVRPSVALVADVERVCGAGSVELR